MRYSGRPSPGPLRLVVLAVATLFIVAVVFFFLIGAAMGDCAPNPDGTGCEHDGLIRFLMFPGSLIAGFIAIFLLVRWAMKSDANVQ